MKSVEKALVGVSITELARLSKTASSFISMLLKGKRNARVGTLRRIAAALEVSMDELDAYLVQIKPGAGKTAKYGWSGDSGAKSLIASS